MDTWEFRVFNGDVMLTNETLDAQWIIDGKLRIPLPMIGDTEEVMLFTGVWDTEENRIYEDDILQAEGQNALKAVVRYVADRGGFFLDYAHLSALHSLTKDEVELRKWKVVGNIHQNRDLIES